MPEVSFTFEFKRNLRALAKKYRSIKADLQPLIDSLEDGELPGDQVPGIHLGSNFQSPDTKYRYSEREKVRLLLDEDFSLLLEHNSLKLKAGYPQHDFQF